MNKWEHRLEKALRKSVLWDYDWSFQVPFGVHNYDSATFKETFLPSFQDKGQ